MWPRLMKEIRWFFLSAVLSIPLSFVYFFMYRLNDAGVGDTGGLTMKVYLTGCLVMFLAVYVARVVIRFVKNAVTE
jgi:hypothetical protein